MGSNLFVSPLLWVAGLPPLTLLLLDSLLPLCVVASVVFHSVSHALFLSLVHSLSHAQLVRIDGDGMEMVMWGKVGIKVSNNEGWMGLCHGC